MVYFKNWHLYLVMTKNNAVHIEIIGDHNITEIN